MLIKIILREEKFGIWNSTGTNVAYVASLYSPRDNLSCSDHLTELDTEFDNVSFSRAKFGKS
jgi:hypothetical protein